MTHEQHILAEIDSERCTELRRELAADQELCSFDELRVIRVFVKRLAYGRQLYGYLDLTRDRRDWKRERAEEYIDLAVYEACIEIERAAKVAPAASSTSTTTYCNRCGMNPCGCDERVWR